MKEEALIKIGLAKNEAKVYLAMLKLGSASVTEISKKANIDRTLIYGVLEKLIEKGLVSSVVKINKKNYEAAAPEKILDLIKEKEEVLNKVLPELRREYKSRKKRQDVHNFKGKNGVRNILGIMLESAKPKKEYLLFGATGKTQELLPYYVPQFHMKRISLGIKLKIIFSKDSKKRALEVKKLKLTEVKLLPSEYMTPTAISIAGNKIAIILWSIENPLGVIIENEEIADDFRKYFNLLWKIAKI